MPEGNRAERAARPESPDVVVQVVQHLGKGGLETMSANLAVALKLAGVRSVVVALNAGGVLEDVLAAQGVEYHVLGGGGYRSLRTHTRLAGVLRATGARAVHTHHFAALLAAVGVTRAMRVPRLVHTEHAYQYLEPRPGLRRALRWMSTQCDAFVVVGDSMRDYYVDVVGVAARRLVVIRNGIDSHRYQPRPDKAEARAALGLPDGVLVGTAGRFAAVKNYAMLVRAVAEVRRTHPGTRLVMVGDGDERAALQSLALELGLGDAIHFLGWRADVAKILACLDVFALTSWTEGLPLVIIEAMACAVPVVATAVGDIPHVVEAGRTGYLVPPGDHAALAAALVPLVADATLREALGARARAAVLDRYAQDTMVRAYLREYGMSTPVAAPPRDACQPRRTHAVQ